MCGIISIITILTIQSYNFYALAQNKQQNSPEVIKGKIRDSVYNHAIKSATIAVYNEPYGEVINYQVSNNIGDFTNKMYLFQPH